MKKFRCLWLGCFVLSMFLVGCGGGSNGTASNSPSTPSATTFPFGVESMTMEVDMRRDMKMTMDMNMATIMDSNNLLSMDFVYDQAGQVVEVSTAFETDETGDGRADTIISVVYSIDPSIVATKMPAMEEINDGYRDVVALKPSYENNLVMPVFMENLPGAVVKVVAHRYWNERWFTAQSVQIPEELLVSSLITIDFAYDAGGRLLNIAATMEGSEGVYSYVVDCTYDAAVNLAQTKTVAQMDWLKDGWIDEKGIVETKYTYDESGSLIQKDRDVLGSNYLETTTYEYEGSFLVAEDFRRLYRNDDSVSRQNTITYGYDASGRIVKKVKEEDWDSDPSTVNDIYTYTYGYGESGLISYHVRYQNSGTDNTRAYTYTYNGQGQLTEKLLKVTTSSSGEWFEKETYTYDTEGRLISYGQSEHPSVEGLPGLASWKDTTAYAYGDDGRLNGWTRERAANGTDVTGQSIVELTYDEDGTSAAGTIADYGWDGSALVAEGPVRSLSFTFAAGVPTATMEIPVHALEFYYPANDFEKITLSVKHPALVGIIHYSDLSQMGIPK